MVSYMSRVVFSAQNLVLSLFAELYIIVIAEWKPLE